VAGDTEGGGQGQIVVILVQNRRQRVSIGRKTQVLVITGVMRPCSDQAV
jgi:hypothetical protein